MTITEKLKDYDNKLSFIIRTQSNILACKKDPSAENLTHLINKLKTIENWANFNISPTYREIIVDTKNLEILTLLNDNLANLQNTYRLLYNRLKTIYETGDYEENENFDEWELNEVNR